MCLPVFKTGVGRMRPGWVLSLIHIFPGELVSEAVSAVCGYTNLEYDLDRGTRGNRGEVLERLLCEITQAEAAVVVNNNAAAVLLVLNAVARDGEVLVSRGELVEIGGHFRIPDVMEMSGATLVEVGTTNKTRLCDYEQQLSENTKAVLKVHTSNYLSLIHIFIKGK